MRESDKLKKKNVVTIYLLDIPSLKYRIKPYINLWRYSDNYHEIAQYFHYWWIILSCLYLMFTIICWRVRSYDRNQLPCRFQVDFTVNYKHSSATNVSSDGKRLFSRVGIRTVTRLLTP